MGTTVADCNLRFLHRRDDYYALVKTLCERFRSPRYTLFESRFTPGNSVRNSSRDLRIVESRSRKNANCLKSLKRILQNRRFPKFKNTKLLFAQIVQFQSSLQMV